MTYEELQKEVLSRARDKGACSEGYSAAAHAADVDALIEVIKDNVVWVMDVKMMTPDEIKDWFGEDVCARHDIYFSGRQSLTDKRSLHFGSSTSEHFGSSTSEHFGSSTSKHFGSSTSKHFGSSTSEHYDSSTSEHYDSSTSEHYGSSTCYSSSLTNTKINDRAILRDVTTDTIYIRKGAVTIIEIDKEDK